MTAVRTLTSLGAALGPDSAEIGKRAVSFLTIPTLAAEPGIVSTLEVLVDRLCLSLTLAKPVGLVGWAERESARLGRAAVVDMMSAAAVALTEASNKHEVEARRLGAFIEILSREVERAAIGIIPEETKTQSSDGEASLALLAMLSERDHATCCHSKATAEWARRLSTALGLSEETGEFIALCAVLHDIGKIATPDAVLFKPAPLDDAEWEIMREHSAAGQRILMQIPSLSRCAVIVRAHHERYDGMGYPDGLAGMSIPFEARVVAVADAFHAMISERPYRKPIAPRQALAILKEGRGTQWDPDVVDAMLSMFSRNQVTTRTSANVSSA